MNEENVKPISRFSSPRQDVLLRRLEEMASDRSEPSRFWGNLVTCIAQETSADIVLLFGYKSEAQEWFLFSSWGMPPSFGPTLSRGWQSLTTIIAQETSHALFSGDITHDRRFVGQMVRGTAMRTFAGTTLEMEQGCFGVMVIGFNAPDALIEADQQVFLSFSSQVCAFLATPDFQSSPSAQMAPATPVQSTDPLPISPKTTDGPPTPDSSVIPLSPDLSLAPKTEPVDLSPPGEAMGEPSHEIAGAGPVKTPGSSQTRKNSRSAPGPIAPLQAPSIKKSSPAGPVASVSIRTAVGDLRGTVLEALWAAWPSLLSGENFYREVLRKIVPAIEADRGYIFQWDSTSQRLFPVASEGVSPEITNRILRSGIRPDPVWGRILDKNQSLLISFENWKSPFKKKLFGEERMQSQMAVPIFSEDETWGLLSIFHRSQNFSQKDLNLLEWVGEKMGLAAHTVVQWEDLHKKIERFSVVQGFYRTLTSCDLSSLLDRIKDAMRASNAYLLLLDEQQHRLVGQAASTYAPEGIGEVVISLDEPTLAALTLKQQQPLMVEHGPSDPRIGRKWIEWFRSRSLCSVPLILRERILGVLLIDETTYFRCFTPEEIKTLVALSHPAAYVISTAMQYQEALRKREQQEALSLAVLQTHEGERRVLADSLEQEMGKRLVTVQKAIQESLASLAEKVPADTPALKPMEESKVLLEKSGSDLKALLADMNPNTVEKQGLLPAVREYTQKFSEETGVPIKLNLPSALKRSSPGFDLLIYRIIQEALCNVKKHARAKWVVLTMEYKEPFLELSLMDNGQGFDLKRYWGMVPAKRRGMGLVAMKARTDLVGGVFFIESALQRGTRVSVKIPVMKRDGL